MRPIGIVSRRLAPKASPSVVPAINRFLDTQGVDRHCLPRRGGSDRVPRVVLRRSLPAPQRYSSQAGYNEAEAANIRKSATWALHRRLTWIHPFPNGNCRVARVLADCFLPQLGTEPLTWGRSLLLRIEV